MLWILGIFEGFSSLTQAAQIKPVFVKKLKIPGHFLSRPKPRQGHSQGYSIKPVADARWSIEDPEFHNAEEL